MSERGLHESIVRTDMSGVYLQKRKCLRNEKKKGIKYLDKLGVKEFFFLSLTHILLPFLGFCVTKLLNNIKEEGLLALKLSCRFPFSFLHKPALKRSMQW